MTVPLFCKWQTDTEMWRRNGKGEREGGRKGTGKSENEKDLNHTYAILHSLLIIQPSKTSTRSTCKHKIIFS